ncbi:hypothetical protein BX616_011198 [Lobosporangium transversale]|nr:hypothetical protein BX616_011198 [Lobosporangium transversale]
MSKVSKFINTRLDMLSLIACTQVSKAWSEEFTPHVWRTVDLVAQLRFKDLDSRTISKNGRHIRVIKNIYKRSELNLLEDSCVSNLEHITICIKPEDGYCQQARRLLSQNSHSLTRLEILRHVQGDPKEFALAEAMTPLSEPYTSRLTEIYMRDLSMPRASFSSFLATCPLLEEVNIRRCSFLPGDSDKPLFRHQRVKSLISPIEQIFSPAGQNSSCPSSPSPPPLIVHFPNITFLDTWSDTTSTLDNPTSSDIKIKLMEHCPHLTEFSLSDTLESLVKDLLINTVSQLSLFWLYYQFLSPSMILAVLRHKSTLKRLQTYDPSTVGWSPDADRVIPVYDALQERWIIQLLLSKCSNLTIVDLPEHELDMSIVHLFPWACKGLKELRIRIIGLDTKELIMAVIKLWARGYNEKQRTLYATTRKHILSDLSSIDYQIETTDAQKLSIVNKVTTHLLQFNDLTKVWLGYKVWSVKWTNDPPKQTE